MANFQEPFRRLISTDGSLTSANTQVGDGLYNQFTFALSFRGQDASGAPVEIAVPSITGGSGTQNRLVKFTGTGSMDDSNVTDTGNGFTVGGGGTYRFFADYAGGTGWFFIDNANNTVFTVGPTGKLTVASDITIQGGALILQPLLGAAGALQVNAFGLVEKQSDASNSPYTAAIPGNWNGAAPTNVEAAIDRLAAAVAGLLGGPIP